MKYHQNCLSSDKFFHSLHLLKNHGMGNQIPISINNNTKMYQKNYLYQETPSDVTKS